MMTEITAGARARVPQPIVRKLRQLIRRVRLIIALKGLCAVVAAATSSLLAVMAIDYGEIDCAHYGSSPNWSSSWTSASVRPGWARLRSGRKSSRSLMTGTLRASSRSSSWNRFAM